MLLVKPIRRWVLLVYKYAGGLTFIVLNGAYAVIGVWLVLGLRTGVWANGLLLLIPTLTFFFAGLYAVSTFVSVLTRSTIVTIIATISAWFLCFVVGTIDKQFVLKERIEIRQARTAAKSQPSEQGWGKLAAKVVHAVHVVTPRTEELNQLNERIAYFSFMTSVWEMSDFDTGDRPWWEDALVSIVWIILFLSLACLWFTYREQ
jgi:ABC-type transport system involved in multi-copper enzyme maturation permease subunit